MKTSDTAGGIWDYVYDNNGNMVSKTKSVIEDITPEADEINASVAGESENDVSCNLYMFKYDNFNQMTVVIKGSDVVEYRYNGEGLRVSETKDGETTLYLYEYDKVILETDENGNEKARNVYGTNLICRTDNGDTLYYRYNGHADVTALIDENGNTAASYYYDTFGNIKEKAGSADNPYRYAGYRYDDETELYYLSSRMYDAKIARFMQEDTYKGTADDPLSLNLYVYCVNNPIRYFDPTGHGPGDKLLVYVGPRYEKDYFVVDEKTKEFVLDENGNKQYTQAFKDYLGHTQKVK